jgi:hypothetical protein
LISPESWKRLPMVGTMDNGRGVGEFIELRNCSCGSTISKAIGEHAPPSDPLLPAAPESKPN